MNHFYSFLFGLALGFSLTVPPGPMNSLIVARSSMSWERGVITGLGAMSADMLIGTVVFLLRETIHLRALLPFIYVAGGLVMMLFSISLISGREEKQTMNSAGAYIGALLLGASNPFQIIWWLTAGLAFAYLGGAVLFTGLFSAIAIWVIALPTGVSRGMKAGMRLGDLIDRLLGLSLLAFALYFLYMAFMVYSA